MDFVRIPALFAADIVFRFGFPRLSSKILFESCCDASLDMVFSSSVEECCCVELISWADVVLIVIVDIGVVLIFCVDTVGVKDDWVGFGLVAHV